MVLRAPPSVLLWRDCREMPCCAHSSPQPTQLLFWVSALCARRGIQGSRRLHAEEGRALGALTEVCSRWELPAVYPQPQGQVWLLNSVFQEGPCLAFTAVLSWSMGNYPRGHAPAASLSVRPSCRQKADAAVSLAGRLCKRHSLFP